MLITNDKAYLTFAAAKEKKKKLLTRKNEVGIIKKNWISINFRTFEAREICSLSPANFKILNY